MRNPFPRRPLRPSFVHDHVQEDFHAQERRPSRKGSHKKDLAGPILVRCRPRRWPRPHDPDRGQRNNEGGGTPAHAYLQPPRPHLHPQPARAGGQRRGRGARPRRQVYASLRTQNPRDAPPVGVPPRRLLQRANAATQLRTRFLGRGVSCPSPASSSQAGHSAGRALLRSRPGAQVTSPRPREPPPLHRPVSPADVLRKRESAWVVT